MKKVIATICGLGLVLATTSAAMADVEIDGQIIKNKSKTVTEDVYIDKNIEIGVKHIVKASNSVEAQAVKNDVNQNNNLEEAKTDAVPPTYVDNDITNETLQQHWYLVIFCRFAWFSG